MRFLFSLAAAPMLLAGTAFGWGCEGHEVVALIARAHLTPAVSAAVDQLLNANPIDPAQKRYCQNRAADPMANAASWADDMKSIDKTFTWHFVDIPLGVRDDATGRPDLMRWCEAVGPSVEGKDRPGCIVSAIEYEWGVLRDRSQPEADRAKALRYLIHFLGDLSQPLHDADNHDQGGNCTRISFFGNEKLENLHAIWDERMIRRDLNTHNASVQKYAAGLDREFAAKWASWGLEKTDVAAWAWEGHAIAAEVTYGKLRPQLPVASPEDGNADKAACELERTQVEALHVAVGDEYVHEALPVVRRQLARAGYRLADVLNQGF